jgi:LemA protein
LGQETLDSAAPLIWIAVLFLLILLVWVIGTYNRFAALRNLVRESASGIDIALKRRHDLVPNLVETVKGYAAHEYEVLDRITRARTDALQAVGDLAALATSEAVLVAALNEVFLRVEAYPKLRADQHFLALQAELANTEDRIAAARRFYNANVRSLNVLLESFPTGIVGRSAGLRLAPYFEIDSVDVRSLSKVAFEDQGIRSNLLGE